MRTNAALAAEVLGTVLADSAAAPRDRVAAARVVLEAAGPLFSAPLTSCPEPVESRGLPSVEHNNDWRAILTETAETAGQMARHLYLNAQTPGQAWASSGLEAGFPGSYARLRALANNPEELRVQCAAILADWTDALDAKAIAEANEDSAGG